MADRESTDSAADADPSDGRDESLNERMDRNWNEILQELRVTQTGTQILTGFLLAIAFQPKFDELTTFQHRIYLILVLTAVLTTALGLAPVNLHRGLFRQHAKRRGRPDSARHHADDPGRCRPGADRHRAADLRCGRRTHQRPDRRRLHPAGADPAGRTAAARAGGQPLERVPNPAFNSSKGTS